MKPSALLSQVRRSAQATQRSLKLSRRRVAARKNNPQPKGLS